MQTPIKKSEILTLRAVNGVELSPDNIPHEVLLSLISGIEELVNGSQKEAHGGITYQIGQGSFMLKVYIVAASAAFLSSFGSDLKAMAEGRTAGVDSRRVAAYRKLSDIAGVSELRLSSQAGSFDDVDIKQARIAEEPEPVLVESEADEKAVVEAIGGASDPSVRLRLWDGRQIVARSNREYLEHVKDNFLYKPVMASYSYMVNVKTRERSQFRIKELSLLKNDFNTTDFFEKLRHRKSKWSEVPDHIAEIRRLRGAE